MPASQPSRSLPRRILDFYVEGFKAMTVGRSLWALIIIKLLIMFGILKLFFFPNLLSRDYDTDAERASAVRTRLLTPPDSVAPTSVFMSPGHP